MTAKKSTKGGSKRAARAAKSKSSAEKATGKRRKTSRAAIASFVFAKGFKPSKKIGSGGVMPKSAALGRLMRWPRYVKLQRQRKILLQRLAIPPAINLFAQTASKPLARALFKMFSQYKPETRRQKKDRLRAAAKLEADGKEAPSDKPVLIKYGFNHVTTLVESGRAKLVLIAHDVDPIELVLWLPTLCVKKGVPFAIVKSKSRLGSLVNKKTAACLALTEVSPDRESDFQALRAQCTERWNDQFDQLRRKRGAKVLGIKTRHRVEKRRRARLLEAQRRRAARQG